MAKGRRSAGGFGRCVQGTKAMARPRTPSSAGIARLTSRLPHPSGFLLNGRANERHHDSVSYGTALARLSNDATDN